MFSADIGQSLKILLYYIFLSGYLEEPIHPNRMAWVGIGGTTAKSRKCKCVPSSHPGPFALVASSQKSQTKVGTLACFDFLYQNELTM